MKNCICKKRIEEFENIQATDDIKTTQRPAIVKVNTEIVFHALYNGYRDITVIYYCPFCGRKL